MFGIWAGRIRPSSYEVRMEKNEEESEIKIKKWLGDRPKEAIQFDAVWLPYDAVSCTQTTSIRSDWQAL